MLYVFYGTEHTTMRSAADRLLASLGDRVARLEVVRLEGGSCDPGQLTSLTGAASLFGEQMAYVVDTPSEKAEIFNEIIGNAAHFAESANHFILLETALTAADRKVLGANAVSIEEYKAGKADRFNLFTLADALSRKDKRNLWIGLQEAGRAGIKTEEIIGVLWWQIKLLRLAAVTQTAAEAGVSDFPYNKAKRALKLFGPGEIERGAQALLVVYHDGHMGKRDIDLALEEWVLRL